MESAIIQRVIELVKVKSSSSADFSKRIGVAQTTFNNYIKLHKTPTSATLLAILDSFPDISAEWLMRGEGSMYRVSSSAQVIVNGPQTVSGSNNITNSPHAQQTTQSQDIINILTQQISQLQEQNANLNALLSSLINNK